MTVEEQYRKIGQSAVAPPQLERNATAFDCEPMSVKILSPNPPNGVVEMAEQGIRDLEERLSW